MSFTFEFTEDQLTQLLPKNKECADWFYYLQAILPDYEITTPRRVAAFIAQCSHESGQFTVLEENLRYNAAGLMRVWPRLFPTQEIANQYSGRPEKIANKVYASRMGNGVEASGEGWKYRGRGVIQLTGKSNYTACSKSLYDDETLVDNPDLLLNKDSAIYAACWYWHSHDLNKYADMDDMLTITKKINGGTMGLEERKKNYDTALSLFQSSEFAS